VSGRLADTHALVTGAGRGINEAVATLFAEEGARVTVLDIDGESAERVAAAIGGTAVRADVRSADDVTRAFAQARDANGPVDVLHNGAAVVHFARAHELEEQDWDRLFETNVKGYWLCAREAIPEMLERGGGTIVQIASVAGTHGMPYFPHYNATKGAVIAFTRQLAAEYGPAIRVNCISPGPTDTPAVRDAIAAAPDPTAFERELAESNRIVRRLAQPREIAYAALFLASQESSFVHGHNLVVGGGQGVLP
jgi:NAD(P)-dependent dehydrogenase (short-subunit alcohol dehydrogenase family)